MRLSSSALAAIFSGVTTVTALSTIEAVGNKFFSSDGKQFFMKGVAYQLLPDDPLMDTEQCQADASLMKTLGANTIRVYHVDPKGNHDGCMKAFADAGIYALIDMDTFTSYLLTGQMAQWSQNQSQAYADVMDAFEKYDNLLGLFVGNEVINNPAQSYAAPYIKAAARDMRRYRDEKGYRKFPIGYSAADIAQLRPMLQDYLTCGGNSSETIEFFALNSYEWCDPSTYETSGYQALQDDAKNFPVPIFFSETGCNQPGPRLFDDQAAIFGPRMVDTWSGSMVYEWIQEENHYGLISYGAGNGDTFGRNGTPTPVEPDFDNLKKHWATISPTGVPRSVYNAAKSVSTRDCPKSTAGGWLVDGNVRMPSIGESMTAPPDAYSAQSYASASPATDTWTGPPPSVSASASASVSGSAYGSGAEPTGTQNGPPAHTSSPAQPGQSASNQIVGMSAGLACLIIIFALWV